MNLASLLGDVKRIRDNSDAERSESAEYRTAVLDLLADLADDVHEILRFLTEPPPVVGIAVSPEKPVPRKGDSMPTATIKLTKKKLGAAAPKKAKAGDPPLVNFTMQDNQDDTCTVSGVDAAGAPVDISAVATITAVSDNPAVLTTDPPAGMTFNMHGVAPGSANVTVIATWNDGSVGPFTFVLPTTETPGTAGGIVVTPGTPTVRP